jgi:hypothetical protein
MDDMKPEPLAAPIESPQSPQPTKSAKPSQFTAPSVPGKFPTTLKKWLLYAVAAYFGILLLVLLAQIPRWIREARDRHIHTAVNTVTPDSAIARCGQAVEDVTKDLYPMISRTMTYSSPIAGNPGPGKVILFFSRTSEENSDWVFSSMKDETRKITYNTPEEQLAALPCLVLTK